MKLTLFFLLSTSLFAQTKIGIFGDVHGHYQNALAVFEQMKNHGVTHIIGLGDFTGKGLSTYIDEDDDLIYQNEIDFVRQDKEQKVYWGALTNLRDILGQMSPTTGVPKENIYLIPGNWEHEIGFKPKLVNKILANYGQLVFDNYDGYGDVSLNGHVIRVSHFPQHKIPDEFLPPPVFRKQTLNGRIPQAWVMQTVQREIFPAVSTQLELIAHTHVGGAFFEETSQTLVVNPGVLDPHSKTHAEPNAFAIFDLNQKLLLFYDVSGKELTKVRNDFCGKLLLKEL